jgi:hypothetical protein
MQINWTTGIVINGGTGYPLSGISLQGDHLWIPALSTAGVLHNSAAGLIQSSALGSDGVIPMYDATLGVKGSLLTQAAAGTITMNEGTSHYSTISLVHTTATGYVSYSAVNDNASSSLVSTVYGHSSTGGTHCGLAEASLARIYSYSPVALLIDVGQSVPIVFGIVASEIARLSPGNAASPAFLSVTGLINCVDAHQNVIVSSPHGLLTTAQYNAVFGYEAMYMNQISPQNTACGTQALYHINSGVGYNVGVGSGAGQHFTGGEGYNNATGTYSVFLGANTLAKADGETNEIVIGYGATGNGSNTATYGNSSITSHVFTAGAITMNGTLCGLTAGQIPMGSTTGLAASPLYSDGSFVGIGATTFTTRESNTGNDYTIGTLLEQAGTPTFGLGVFTTAHQRLVFGGNNGTRRINTSEIYCVPVSLVAGAETGQMWLRTKATGGVMTTAITIDATQNVGIGCTPAAGMNLDVNGKIAVDHIGEHTAAHTIVFDNKVGIGGVCSMSNALDVYSNSNSSNTLYLQNVNTSYGTLLTFPKGWIGEHGADYGGTVYGINYANLFRVTAGSNDTMMIDTTGPLHLICNILSISQNGTNTIASFGYGGTGISFPYLAPGAGSFLFKISTSGLLSSAQLDAGDIKQATTAGKPTYVKGDLYFDTTLNKLRIGGATAWETITSV